MSSLPGLPRGPVPEVARALLGWTISHRTASGTVSVRLSEVEAYGGLDDAASHAHRGPTPRNQVMFGPPGRLYVYLSYGVHWCCNVVTGPEGEASAVLLRAGEVTEGVELARARRGPRTPVAGLARGPGCVGQALGISGEQTGADLVGDGQLTLRRGAGLDGDLVRSGPRVGVRLEHERPWRFWVDGDPSVSRYQRSPRAR